MSKKFGLDFGTTNSSIAVEEQGVGKVLDIDLKALDPRVVRSLLYFLRRELTFDKSVTEKQLNSQEFQFNQIIYSGDQDYLVGQEAVNQYLVENQGRHRGKRRKIYTGRMLTPTGAVGAIPVAEYYYDIDYGTGRLIQALKTALKSPYYKGTGIFGKYFTLEDMIQTFLGEIKQKAEEALGERIDSVVCGRPVKFSDDPDKDKAAQDRLEQALKQVGFKEIKFQFEPVAAARQFLAYSHPGASETLQSFAMIFDHSETSDEAKGLSTFGDRIQTKDSIGTSSLQNDKVVFVFDFGGGTLDTAIVKSGTGEVLASDGVYIGGDLLNADILEHKLWSYFGYGSHFGENAIRVPDYIYEELGSWYSIPNLNNPDMMDLLERCRYKNINKEAIDRLIHLIRSNLGFEIYEAIEQAKKTLSAQEEAVISFADGPIDIKERITREEFEEMIAPRVEEIREVIERTLEKAGVKASEIDLVVRTGGSSLIPIFEKLLVDTFGGDKVKQFETFTSIAAGLALER